MRRRLEFQYRGAVLGGIVCQVFFGLILIAIYRALYAGKPQAMPLSQITSYVWLQQAFFRMLLASVFRYFIATAISRSLKYDLDNM